MRDVLPFSKDHAAAMGRAQARALAQTLKSCRHSGEQANVILHRRALDVAPSLVSAAGALADIGSPMTGKRRTSVV